MKAIEDFKERLAMAYQVIDGIPDEAINLESYRSKKGKTLGCGTICCGAGWLALHPVFREMGLKTNRHGQPRMKGSIYSYAAMNQVFGDERAFYKYFAKRSHGEWDIQLITEGMTDKQLLLARIKRGYHEHV